MRMCLSVPSSRKDILPVAGSVVGRVTPSKVMSFWDILHPTSEQCGEACLFQAHAGWPWWVILAPELSVRLAVVSAGLHCNFISYFVQFNAQVRKPTLCKPTFSHFPSIFLQKTAWKAYVGKGNMKDAVGNLTHDTYKCIYSNSCRKTCLSSILKHRLLIKLEIISFNNIILLGT